MIGKPLRGRGCTSHTRMTEQSLAHAQRPSRLSTAAPINGDTGRHRTRAPVTQPETEARGLAPTRNAKRPRRRRPRSSSPEDRISTTAHEVERRPRVTRGKQTRGSAAPPFAARRGAIPAARLAIRLLSSEPGRGCQTQPEPAVGARAEGVAVASVRGGQSSAWPPLLVGRSVGNRRTVAPQRPAVAIRHRLGSRGRVRRSHTAAQAPRPGRTGPARQRRRGRFHLAPGGPLARADPTSRTVPPTRPSRTSTPESPPDRQHRCCPRSRRSPTPSAAAHQPVAVCAVGRVRGRGRAGHRRGPPRGRDPDRRRRGEPCGDPRTLPGR
jgi:hypothetical protein